MKEYYKKLTEEQQQFLEWVYIKTPSITSNSEDGKLIMNTILNHEYNSKDIIKLNMLRTKYLRKYKNREPEYND